MTRQRHRIVTPAEWMSTLPDEQERVISLGQEEGFCQMAPLRLALSSITRGGYKYEPVLVFRKIAQEQQTEVAA